MRNILFFILLSIPVSASHASNELNVRWTEYMDVDLEDAADNPPKVPSDFSRVFNTSWLTSNVVQIEVKNTRDGSSSLVTISDCSQALANEHGMSTKDAGLWDYITSKILSCKIFQQMEKMSPSKRSYVDTMTPNDYVKALNETKLESEFNEVRNLFVGLHDKESVIRCSGNYKCTYKTLLNIYNFYILAFGDYNNDEIEDVLFLVRNNYREGSGFFRVALIGTKKTNDGPFQIIKIIE